MRTTDWGGHINGSFDEFRLSNVGHGFVTAQELGCAETVPALQRLNRLLLWRRRYAYGCHVPNLAGQSHWSKLDLSHQMQNDSVSQLCSVPHAGYPWREYE